MSRITAFSHLKSEITTLPGVFLALDKVILCNGLFFEINETIFGKSMISQHSPIFSNRRRFYFKILGLTVLAQLQYFLA